MSEAPVSEIEFVVENALEVHDDPTGQVLGVLGCVQEHFGYIPETALGAISSRLGVSVNRLESVCASFHDFTTTPLGRHVFVVCDGTACHTGGSPELIQLLEQCLGIKPGETTPDGRFSLMVARCVGSCGQAPILIVDGNAIARIRLSDVVHMVKRVDHG